MFQDLATSGLQERLPATKILLVVPSWYGSLGDEAIILGFVTAASNLGRQVTIDLLDLHKGNWAKHYPHFNKVISFRNYLESKKRGLRWFDALKLRPYDSVVLLGTDVMDGHYSEMRSLLRFDLLSAAAALGKKAFLVGFSFNRHPPARIRETWERESQGIRFFSRDPESLSRLRDLFPNVTFERSADLAFLLKPASLPRELLEHLARKKSEGYRLVALNINYQVFGEYADYLEHRDNINEFFRQYRLFCAEQKIFTVFLPHDRRGPTNDWAVIEDLLRASAFPGDDCFVPPMEDWCAAKNKALVSLCELCLTGRMHVSIAALGSKVPVLLVDYQDKGKGLLELFGLDDMLLRPSMFDTPSAIIEKLEHALLNEKAMRETIARRLPQVEALARAQVRACAGVTVDLD